MSNRRFSDPAELEALRKDYEADDAKLAVLAKRYGCHERTICRTAAREGWTRRKAAKPPVTVACDVGLYEMAEVTIEPVAREATYSEALRQVRKDYGLLMMVAMGLVALMVWPLARGLGWLTR